MELALTILLCVWLFASPFIAGSIARTHKASDPTGDYLRAVTWQARAEATEEHLRKLEEDRNLYRRLFNKSQSDLHQYILQHGPHAKHEPAKDVYLTNEALKNIRLVMREQMKEADARGY